MIDWRRQCAAVIPCFNEAGRIGPVVQEVREHLPAVIVVDDGSADATASEARSAGALVISRPINGGKGIALRAGWQRAKEMGFAWAVTLDGDGQHAPADIPKFFARMEDTQASLVIGNRMAKSKDMPFSRRLANDWMSRSLSKMTGVFLPDSQCGFRLLHLETVLALGLIANGFVIESETLVQFLAAGKEVEFVPVQMIYGPEESKIRPMRDAVRWLRWWAGQEPVSS